MRSIQQRLQDMIEAIAHIERYVKRGQTAFQEDELVQTWMIRHLHILGEAATKLPTDFCVQHPEIPWQKINGMRHILVHDYFAVDLGLIWQTIITELPPLKHQLLKVLEPLS